MAKRLKAARVSDDEDRFTLLPDDILIHNILSFLPMKEAARTSVLARRWRFLWLCVPSLDFDASEVVARVPLDRWETVFPKEGGEAAFNYIEWVDGVINAYRGCATLRHFRVIFRLGPAFSRKIESWLMFSLAKGVEILELDCIYNPLPDSSCKFPSISPGQHPTLKSLKSLILRGLAITSDSLNHLLQGSPLLERLELCLLRSLQHVNVAGPVSRLKSIHLLDCYGVRSIQISAPTPDLVSFIYTGAVQKVHLEHAPQLVELSISQPVGGSSHDLDLISHPLFHYVSQLEALRLQIGSWDKLPRFLDLRRLKHLYLSILGLEDTFHQGNRSKLRGLASLINAASCVQHLTLVVGDLDSKLKIRDEFAELDLQQLRVIEIVGHRGRRVEWELALCLMKAAAASLEKLIINLQWTSMLFDVSKWRIDRCTSSAKELIERGAPSSRVDLVVTGYRKVL